jgi:hypothetical protein
MLSVKDPPKSEVIMFKICLDDKYSHENCYRFKLTIDIPEEFEESINFGSIYI